MFLFYFCLPFSRIGDFELGLNKFEVCFFLFTSKESKHFVLFTPKWFFFLINIQSVIKTCHKARITFKIEMTRILINCVIYNYTSKYFNYQKILKFNFWMLIFWILLISWARVASFVVILIMVNKYIQQSSQNSRITVTMSGFPVKMCCNMFQFICLRTRYFLPYINLTYP